MIIKLKELKDVCNTILAAVDSNELSKVTETLELKVVDQTLYMAVTNQEYYAQVKLALGTSEDFHATVNANLFLKLISQITTDDVELSIKENVLMVKGNGTYNIPLIYDNDVLLELPKIDINNVTSTFNIGTDILLSILNFNSKELVKGSISKPVQKLYYIDEKGAITFTSGACVNSFSLAQPIKILLNNRLVKLFKLFKEDVVTFTLGYDAVNDEMVQTKVKFETPTISITAILNCDDSMLNQVPVEAIRARANNEYDYSVIVNKNALLQTISRLSLFNAGYGSKEILKPYSTFLFDAGKVTIFDVKKDNKEDIKYEGMPLPITKPYEALIDIVDLKLTLDTYNDEYITLNFGDHKAVVLSRPNVKVVIPECKLVG